MPGDAGAIGAGLTDSAGDTAADQARNALSSAYKDEILPVCRAATKFYPFASGGGDIPVTEFQRIFGPGGVLTAFIDNRLAPYVDTSGKTWKPKAGDPVARTLSSSAVASLQLAKNISGAMFLSPYGVGGLGFRMQVEVVSIGPDVASAKLSLGGLQSADLAAKGAVATLEWIPGPGMDTTSLVIAPRDPALAPLSFQPPNGIWSIFRLLDSGKCQPCTSKTRNYTFGQGGLSITLNFTVPGSPPSGEAFDKTKLWKFKCPAAL